MELDSLYQEVILDAYRNPKNRGRISNAQMQVHHNNPSCGDEVTLTLNLSDDKVSDIKWDGVGCSISMASASMMSELVMGKTSAQALQLLDKFSDLMQSKGKGTASSTSSSQSSTTSSTSNTSNPNAGSDDDLLQDAAAFVGVSKFPARIKCALLGWMAFKDALLRIKATKD
jgi:nitrogen fixation NifU-like protein